MDDTGCESVEEHTVVIIFIGPVYFLENFSDLRSICTCLAHRKWESQLSELEYREEYKHGKGKTSKQ